MNWKDGAIIILVIVVILLLLEFLNLIDLIPPVGELIP